MNTTSATTALAAQSATDGFQRPDDPGRPLRYLVIAQRALGGLELCPQQDGIFARRNSAAAEHLCRPEALHLGDVQREHCRTNLRKAHVVSEHEREVAIDRREPGKRLVTR